MFGVVLGVIVAALIVVGVIDLINGGRGTTLVVTEDGHVHTADGTHVGTVEEIFGEGAVATEDGHVHTEDGTHVGDISDIVLTEDDHDHADGDEQDEAEGAAE